MSKIQFLILVIQIIMLVLVMFTANYQIHFNNETLRRMYLLERRVAALYKVVGYEEETTDQPNRMRGRE